MDLLRSGSLWGKACRLGIVGSIMRPGVANIGRNPTFGEFEMTVEAHILDFKGKLYDQPIRVHFVQRIRSEKKFSGPEELITRIREDIGLARMETPTPPCTQLLL